MAPAADHQVTMDGDAEVRLFLFRWRAFAGDQQHGLRRIACQDWRRVDQGG
jgi:hypothetical protein